MIYIQTYCDERGYFVTKMVMEEVEEEEGATDALEDDGTRPAEAAKVAVKPAAAVASAKGKVKPVTAPAKKGAAAGAAGQKSVMSFFGAKK